MKNQSLNFTISSSLLSGSNFFLTNLLKSLVPSFSRVNSKRKFLQFLLLIGCLLTIEGRAQTYGCKLAQTMTTNVLCLNNPFDYYPTTGNDTIKIHLNFCFLKPAPTTGTPNPFGVFDTLSIVTATEIVYFMNSHFDSIWPPQLVHSPPAPYISHPKIRFYIDSVLHPVNSQAYYHAPVWNTIAPKPNAINLIFGTNTVAGTYGKGIASGIPGKELYMIDYTSNTQRSSYTSNTTAESQASLILHEITHCLGLYHTDSTQAGSYAARGVDDYFVEDTATIWGKSAGCSYTVPATRSNNIQGYNWNCKHYLSPKQIGLMYYYFTNGTTTHLAPDLCNYDPTKSISINTPTVWTSSKLIRGDLTIKAGNTLTVQCRVAMPKGGRVIVERGAKLVIDGGEITSACGNSWGGIEVCGTPLQDQSFNLSTGLANYQGYLFIKNGGTVSYCGNAVKNYTTAPGGTVDWSSTGGIIQATDAYFLNNARDVEFQSYPYFYTKSSFYKCHFRTNDSTGGRQKPFAHVSMWNVDIANYAFRACTFEYIGGYPLGTVQGTGILSCDATYRVDQVCTSTVSACSVPTTFSNLDRGVRVYNSNPLAVAMVNNCLFDNCLGDGVNFLNMQHFTFSNNQINTQLSPASSAIPNGVYLNTCKSYLVKNNNFYDNTGQKTSAMYIYNSQDGSHQVYRNRINDFKYAINCVGNNSGDTNTVDGLKLNCNDFSYASSFNLYDITVLSTLLYAPPLPILSLPGSVMRNQGLISAVYTPTLMVRNKYGAICVNANKWYTSPSMLGQKIVVHPTTADAITQPLPHTSPVCSGTNISVAVTPLTSLNYGVDCPNSLPSEGGYGSSNQRMLNLNSYIHSLQSARTATNQFEIQAATSAKLQLFLSDSALANKDSVISTIANNAANIKNADVLLVFAYLNKNDFTNATLKANALSASRADWKALLLKLITIYQDPNKIYSINTNSGYKSFLQDYANTAGKDGQSTAQALLKFVCNIDYIDPKPYPSDGSGDRIGSVEQNSISTVLALRDEVSISVFPNPARKGFILSCKGYQNVELQVEIKDLLGKVIFSKFISNDGEHYISLSEYNSGVYLITVNKNKELVYKTKLIKQE